jgi:hypothetical protein
LKQTSGHPQHQTTRLGRNQGIPSRSDTNFNSLLSPKSIQGYQNSIWEIGGPNDEVAAKINGAVSLIEGVCRPILDPKKSNK